MLPIRSLICLVLLHSLNTPVFAQPIFLKIADDTTHTPGTPAGTFHHFGSASREGPTLYGVNNLGFFAGSQNTNNNDSVGYFAYSNGSLQRIISGNTIDPVSGVPFNETLASRSHSTSGGVFFTGPSNSTPNLYFGNNNTAIYLAGVNTPLPGATSHILGITNVSAGSIISFDAGGMNGVNPVNGTYQYQSGTVTRIIDSNMNVPFSNTPLQPGISGNPVVSGAKTAFFARSTDGTVAGIFTFENNQYGLIANTSTLVPGHTFSFVSFDPGNFGISGNSVVFSGSGNDNNNSEFGLYALLNGTLKTIATQGMFGMTSFNAVSIQNDHIAFVADTGLYYWADGQLTELFRFGEQMDGRVVNTMAMYYQGLLGDQLAIRAIYDEPGFPEGLYLVSGLTAVPEPSSWQLLLLTMSSGIIICRVRLKSKQKTCDSVIE